MSSRLLKKLQQDELAEELSEEEELIEVAPVKKTNLFQLLAGSDDEDDSDDEDPESVPVVTVKETPKPQPVKQPAPKPAESQPKRANAKKKQQKKKQQKKKKQQQLSDQQIKSIDQALKELQQSPATKREGEDHLLKIDPAHLLASNEIKRMFGNVKLEDAEDKSNAKELRNRRQPKRNPRAKFQFKRQTKLTQPQDTWPPFMHEDLIMEPTKPPADASPDSDVQYFRFKWTPHQESVQQSFLQCIETGDPNSLIHLLMRNPYHVGTLLQLAELFKHTGEFQTATEFIERALYALEVGFNREFDWKTNQSRVLYSHMENKDLFRALFRHIQMLDRRGCCRTALECCKLLLGFDHSDPLFILGVLDYYALRSKQYIYLLRFFNDFHSKSLLLPNFYYSIALAAYHIEHGEQNDKADFEHPSANELLQQALSYFPGVLLPLVTKCKKDLINTDTRRKLDLALEPFFLDCYQPDSLVRLTNLYVDRVYSLWTAQPVHDWLSFNTCEVLKRFASNPEQFTGPRRELERAYPTQDSRYSSIQASDYNDEVQQLPEDVLQQQYVPNQAPPPVIPARTNNPLALFLQTLLPWNEVPNAPPVNVEGAENQNLMAQLQAMMGYESEEDEENADFHEHED